MQHFDYATVTSPLHSSPRIFICRSLDIAITELDTTITGIYNSITGRCCLSQNNVSIKLYLQWSIGLTLKYCGIVCNLWAGR
jgi:hypothetical protein